MSFFFLYFVILWAFLIQRKASLKISNLNFLEVSLAFFPYEYLGHSRHSPICWFVSGAFYCYELLYFLLQGTLLTMLYFIWLVNADAAILRVRERSQSVLKQNRWVHHMTVSLISPPYWCGSTESSCWMEPGECSCSASSTFWQMGSHPSREKAIGIELRGCFWVLRDTSSTVSVSDLGAYPPDN